VVHNRSNRAVKVLGSVKVDTCDGLGPNCRCEAGGCGLDHVVMILNAGESSIDRGLLDVDYVVTGETESDYEVIKMSKFHQMTVTSGSDDKLVYTLELKPGEPGAGNGAANWVGDRLRDLEYWRNCVATTVAGSPQCGTIPKSLYVSWPPPLPPGATT
jgi:hypothetical protein